MFKSLTDRFNIQSLKCDWYGSWFWNGFYIFKILMYFFLLIDFNLPLNTMLFAATHAHFQRRRIQKYYRIIIAILCLALLYHDSYLPSIKQIIAQRSNLTGFSLSYIAEFMLDFINFKLIGMFALAIVLVKTASLYLRGTTCVILCFILTQFVSSDTLLKNFTKESNVTVNTNFILKNKDLIAQRGTFNNTNLNRYLEAFTKKEDSRSIEVSYSLESSFEPFNIVLFTIDNVANQDLSTFNANDVYALKRFNLYLTGFNSVTTDFNESKLRLFQSICGQKKQDILLDKRNDKCSLLKMIEQLGYDTVAFFNSQKELNTIADKIGKYTHFPDNINPYVTKPRVLYKGTDRKDIYNDEDIFNSYIRYVGSSDLLSFAYIHSSSLLNGNKDNNFEVSYEEKLTSLLVRINKFMDRLDELGKPTLFIMVPTAGAALKGDKTQLKGMRAIPSDNITNTTVMIKFCGIKNAPQTVSLNDPVSYQSIAYIIAKSVSSNVYSEKYPLSLEAFSEDIPRTELVGETDSHYFIKYKNKYFYKTTESGSNWKEYVK